jgi:2-hydroxy-3-oxopropionate reductase
MLSTAGHWDHSSEATGLTSYWSKLKGSQARRHLDLAAQSTGLALSLGARCGLDPRRLREALLGGIASSRVLDVFGAKMAERLTPGMATRLYDKDLSIVLDLARDAGQALPAAAVVRGHLDRMVAEGKANQDLAAIIGIVERLES